MKNNNNSDCKQQSINSNTVNDLEQHKIELEDRKLREENLQHDNNCTYETDHSGLLIKTTSRPISTYNNGNVDDNISQNDEVRQKIVKKRQRNLMKENSPVLNSIKDLFVLESQPTESALCLPTPSYNRTFNDVLGNENSHVEHLNSNRFCFNCGEPNHTVKECPEPLDKLHIKRAVNAFKKSKRYHDNAEKFCSIEPGNISDKVREAMGLKEGELPFFFYRMRVLGYPPAWLEEAKVKNSDFTIYDSVGNRTLALDEEEGEIYELSYKYDVTKIIDFPGFNKHPGDGFRDDFKFHKVPPLSEKQSKEEFIKSLGNAICNSDEKRRKLSRFSTPSKTNESNINMSLCTAENMTFKNSEKSLEKHIFIQPLLSPEEPPNDYQQSTPPLLPRIIDTSISTRVREENTLCINLYKEMKEEEEGRRSSMLPNSTSSIDSVGKQQHLFTESRKKSTTKSLDLSIPHLTDDSLINKILVVEDVYKQKQPAQVDNTQNEQATNRVKEIHLGTPIRKYTAYDSLPSRENFKQGMSDIVDFYNVPTNSGNYEEMKNVLKQIKKTMWEMQNNNVS